MVHYAGLMADKVMRFQGTLRDRPVIFTDKENLEKNAAAFDGWLQTRDAQFKARHSIPLLSDYGFDDFLEFIDRRRSDIREKLKSISM